MRETVSFEQSLEYCLQELERTGDVEASLSRYPHYADRLRPLLEMAQATRAHYQAVPEAPGGLAAGRERMLAVAAQQRARGVPQTPAKTRLALALRFAGVLLLAVLGMAILGGGVMRAASDSLPGERLYSLKLATEDARLALASAPKARVDLALQFVEERADEVQALAAAGREAPDETLVRLERHIERALTQAENAGEAREELLVQVAARTRTQAQELAQTPVSPPAQAGLERAMNACQHGTAAAEAALGLPAPGAPQPTHEPVQATVTPQGQQEHRHTPTNTPPSTPQRQATPPGPRTTPDPQVTQESQATPQGPQATPSPQATPQKPSNTPQGPSATSPGPQGTPQMPSSTPPGPRGTPEPQATSPGPQGTPQQPSHTPPGLQVTPAPQVTSPGPQDTTPGPKGTSHGP
jgi:hypothetical protein